VREITGTDQVVVESSAVVSPSLRVGKTITRYCPGALVVLLALLVWAPRFSGPIDLRYDGGVYYLLGTSLAKGDGYRILSEPGSPEALQYPPLLPAFIALHQLVLGTTNSAIVAPWLRTSYAAMFIGFAVASLVLARRHLTLGFAIIAVALCLLHFEFIFLSDLLFAELPFALVSVVFALVVTADPVRRPFLREALSFTLAAAGFLLRTAGAALLAAWVLEALIRRRWLLSVVRGTMAAVPILGWQTYVAHVQAGDYYSHPTYDYQRASYQYYNVSYTENMRLIDPFHPELGPLTAGAFATRLVTNLPSVLAALGEGISARERDLARLLERAQRRLIHRAVVPSNLAFVPVFGLTALVLAGVVMLGRGGSWLMVFILGVSVVLVWTTPWPAQFTRYLMPLTPFLSIPAILALSKIQIGGRKWRAKAMHRRVVLAVVLVVIFAVEAYPSIKMFRLRASKEGVTIEPPGKAPSRFFAHDSYWQAWERSVNWLGQQGSPKAIVASSAPHWLYLRTGLRAVLPPMDPDPASAKRLLEAVPVSYVIIDQLEFLDISRRYALPAVESDPNAWRLVHSIGKTTIYERSAHRQ
jgi:hypothetical protein